MLVDGSETVGGLVSERTQRIYGVIHGLQLSGLCTDFASTSWVSPNR